MRSKVEFAPGCHPLENPLVKQVLAHARNCSVSTYIVGGYVRDSIASHDNQSFDVAKSGDSSRKRDVDFAVAGGSAFDFAQVISIEMDGHFVPLDEANDTARVVFDDGSIVDFSGCVGGSIEADLKRRDFTVNALAWDSFYPDYVLDLAGGLKDLSAKTIRAVSKQCFLDDPLRVLRTFRFAHQLDAQIEPATLTWVKELSEGLKSVAPERINFELFESLSGPTAGHLTKQLASSGVLEVVFPELIDCRKVTPNSYHHLGLFDHSVITVHELDKRLPDLPAWMHASARRELSSGVSRLSAARLACILHDIGKPGTWEVTPEGKHTFVAHDKLGAQMTALIAARMRWSRPIERFVTRLVELHLRPGQLFHQGPPTPKAINRFYRTVADDVPELMMVAFADLGATCGAGLSGENRENLEAGLISLMHGYRIFLEEIVTLKPLIGGHDIMQLLQLNPGPIVGELLKALEEARDLKEVVDRAQAEAFVKELYAQKYCK
ncbi:MAG: HDIG domain-containing protein [Candidatus Melainabacteria bacterium]|nr:HDIG domain-containing protein [Candidatus Melainabacteria bacterium]